MQKKVAGKQRRTTQVKPRFAPSKIVAPTDFSDLSQAAVAQAAGLASQYDTSLILVHVVEPILYPVDYLVIPKEMEEGNLVLMDNARKRLEQLRTTLVRGHRRQALAHADGGRQILSVQLIELRFVIEQIELRGAAAHEKIDNPPGSGRKMGSPERSGEVGGNSLALAFPE